MFSGAGATKSNPLLKKKESLIMVDQQEAIVEKISRSTSYDWDVILLLFLSSLSFSDVLSKIVA